MTRRILDGARFHGNRHRRIHSELAQSALHAFESRQTGMKLLSFGNDFRFLHKVLAAELSSICVSEL